MTSSPGYPFTQPITGTLQGSANDSLRVLSPIPVHQTQNKLESLFKKAWGKILQNSTDEKANWRIPSSGFLLLQAAPFTNSFWPYCHYQQTLKTSQRLGLQYWRVFQIGYWKLLFISGGRGKYFPSTGFYFSLRTQLQPFSKGMPIFWHTLSISSSPLRQYPFSLKRKKRYIF